MQKRPSHKKWCGPKSPGEKSCEIKGGMTTKMLWFTRLYMVIKIYIYKPYYICGHFLVTNFYTCIMIL